MHIAQSTDTGLEALRSHSMLERMNREAFDREAVRRILCQWYHPLHYFPTFLSRHMALSPTLAAKTHVSRIVWQELGEGDPERSHERIYVETMSAIGFSPAEFVNTPMLGATRSLVSAYEDMSGTDYATSLGFLRATEHADLAMVSAIGNAVRSFSGATALPWVDIHIRQEPDHTDSVASVLAKDLSTEQTEAVVHGAERMYRLWIDFFSDIERSIGKPAMNRRLEPAQGGLA